MYIFSRFGTLCQQKSGSPASLFSQIRTAVSQKWHYETFVYIMCQKSIPSLDCLEWCHFLKIPFETPPFQKVQLHICTVPLYVPFSSEFTILVSYSYVALVICEPDTFAISTYTYVHILGILIWVTEQDLSRGTKIPACHVPWRIFWIHVHTYIDLIRLISLLRSAIPSVLTVVSYFNRRRLCMY
jgi:hypothetical protein